MKLHESGNEKILQAVDNWQTGFFFLIFIS